MRHVQTIGNLEGRWQGSTDRPISPLGELQLERLAKRGRALEASHVYTSPLPRAVKSAKALNRHLGLPITEVPDLREIGMGDWEGRLIEEIQARSPLEYEEYRRQWHASRAPGGESVAEVYKRVTRALREIAEKHPGGSIIAVAHGGAIRNVCAWVMGGPEKADGIVWCLNASITTLDIDDEGRPHMAEYNDVSHLEGL